MATINGIPVHAHGVDQSLNDLCHASWSCQLSSALSELWLLVVAGAFVLVLLAALSNLRAAAVAVEEEQSRTAAERSAFRSFAERVGTMSPDEMVADGGAHVGTVSPAVAMAEPSSSLSKVREAYRETVMSVPHYDEDYGEALAENMAIEFGKDVAASVEDGRTLSPMIQQLLVSKATAAATQRDRVISQLDREADELESARDAFTDIESVLDDYDPPTLHGVDYASLVDRWDRLDAMEDRCGDVLETRQNHLNERETTQPRGPSLADYVYKSLPVDYPVLAAGAAVLERIEDARHAVTMEAARRA